MDLGRSVSYPFAGPAWLGRLLVGAVLEIVPVAFAIPSMLAAAGFSHRPLHAVRPAPLILAVLASLACRFVVIGYLRRLALGVLEGTGAGLPAWDRFGEDFLAGLKLTVVMLALWLPALGLILVLAALAWMAAAPAVAWVPVVIVAPFAGLLTLLYLPAALLNAISSHDVAAAFDLRRVNARLANVWGPYLLAFAFAIVAEIFAQAGLLLVCVGIFATRFVAHCMAVHAFASLFSTPTPPPLPATPPPAAL